MLAIEAMEALTFFEKSENEALSDEIRTKMRDVRGSDIRIVYQRSDVVYNHLSYKQIGIPESEVISKFKRL